TMQRIVSSPSRPARTFTSSSISCSLIAFRTSGRFSCTVAMGASRVTITISAMATSGSAECAGSERAAQSAESASQRGHLVARGPSARVGQHPDPRARDGLVLLAGGRAGTAEGDPICAHTDERDDARAVAANLPCDAAGAFVEFPGIQLVGTRGRAVDQV